MPSNTTKYIQEFSSGIFPRWCSMLLTIAGLLATAAPIIFGLVKAEVDWWWIVLFVLAIFLFVLYSFLLFCRVAIERDNLRKREGVRFYPCRPSMDVATKYIRSHEVIYAVFATGQGLRDAKVYKDLKRFKYLILLNPDKPHLEKYGTVFHSKIGEDLVEDYKDIRENIRKTTDKASPYVQEVKWLDGCLPFSMMLGDPESGKGEVLIEFYIPHREAYDRPSLIFNQNDYPELFQVLKESYQHMLKEADSAK